MKHQVVLPLLSYEGAFYPFGRKIRSTFCSDVVPGSSFLLSTSPLSHSFAVVQSILYWNSSKNNCNFESSDCGRYYL